MDQGDFREEVLWGKCGDTSPFVSSLVRVLVSSNFILLYCVYFSSRASPCLPEDPNLSNSFSL